MKTGYVLSPEFHRNLWMKFTPVGAVVVAVLFLLIGMATSHLWTSNGADLRAQLLFFMYAFIVFIGGCYAAAFSMREEMKDNTWDFLRVSAISPAQLAFGKLFGATSYTWYWGLLIFFLYYWVFSQDPLVNVVAYYMLMAGLIGHAASFLISISSIPVNTQHLVSRDVGMGTPAFLTGGTVSFVIAMSFLEAFFDRHGYGRSRLFSDMVWYSQPVEMSSFWMVSLSLFLLWLWFGCYRLIRAELMYRVTPFVWVSFLAYLIAWTLGFAFDHETPRTIKNYIRVGSDLVAHEVLTYAPQILAAKWAFFISAATCYLTMLSESNDGRRYARLGGALRRRNLRDVLNDMPRWVAVLPFVAVTFGALLYQLQAAPPGEDADVCLTYFCLAALLFIARDAFALHLLHRTLGRRSALAVLVYFVCVIVAFPMALLSPEHGSRSFEVLVGMIVKMTRVSGSAYYLFPEDANFAVFFPTGTADFAVSVLPALGQASLAALLFFWLRDQRVVFKQQAVEK